MELKNALMTGIILVTSSVLFTCGQNYSNNGHGDMMNDGHMGGGSMMDRQDARQGNGGMTGGGMQGQQGGISEQPDPAGTLDRSDARQQAADYLESTGNTNYFIGEGTEQSNAFVYPILRQADSSRVATLIVDRSTGQVQSER